MHANTQIFLQSHWYSLIKSLKWFIILYVVNVGCSKIFPVLIHIETHAVWGRMQNAKMTLKFSD